LNARQYRVKARTARRSAELVLDPAAKADWETTALEWDALARTAEGQEALKHALSKQEPD